MSKTTEGPDELQGKSVTGCNVVSSVPTRIGYRSMIDRTNLEIFDRQILGSLAEWSFAPVLKTVVGRVAEWSIALVLKTSDAQVSVGSNPTPSAIKNKHLA